MNRLYYLIAVFLVFGLLISSCKKKDSEAEEEPTVSTQSTKDNDLSQKEWDNIFDITKSAMEEHDNNTDKVGFTLCGDTNEWCAVVCIDTSYTDANGAIGRITIDYDSVSPTSCVSRDARIRSGKIQIAYTGKYRTAGTKIYTALENHFVNGIKVEGTKVVENKGNNSFKVDVTGAKLTFLDGTTTTWQSTRTRDWVAGDTTLLNIFDDEYLINGTASGTNRLGIDFTATIIDVRVKLECWLSAVFLPSSGTITVSPAGFSDRVLDYGNGTCDKDVTITVDGKTYSFSF